MSVQWIEYQGKKILSIDYRGLEGDGLIQTFHDSFILVTTTPGKVLILYNFQGVHINQRFMEDVKKVSQPDGETKVEKAAIIGIDPIKALLLNGYNQATDQHIKSFKTEDEAKEWLVQP